MLDSAWQPHSGVAIDLDLAYKHPLCLRIRRAIQTRNPGEICVSLALLANDPGLEQQCVEAFNAAFHEFLPESQVQSGQIAFAVTRAFCGDIPVVSLTLKRTVSTAGFSLERAAEGTCDLIATFDSEGFVSFFGFQYESIGEGFRLILSRDARELAIAVEQ